VTQPISPFLASLCSALCLGVSACGGASPPAAETAASAGSERAAIARWEDESFGPLRLGMTAEQAIAALGEPEARPDFVEMEATGERVASWSWPARGASLTLHDAPEGAVVVAISLAAPSDLRGAHGGVGLGSTREEVLAAYADVSGGEDAEPREDPDQPDRVRIGNAYACLSFSLTDGRVSGILLGSTGAE